MDIKALQDIGLSNGEIKVYLALLELGHSSAGAVLEKAEIQNSVFHFCVNNLIKKGLVSYVKKGKIRVYKASDPENFLIYLKDKEKQIQEILPILKEKQASEKEKQEVELFEGIKGCITLLNISIEDSKKGDEYLFFSSVAEGKNKDIQDFFRRFDLKRKHKGLNVKGIAPSEIKPFFSNRKHLKMKYSDFPVPSNIAICNNTMALFSWDEKPIGVLIKAKNLVEKQKDFFHKLWKKL